MARRTATPEASRFYAELRDEPGEFRIVEAARAPTKAGAQARRYEGIPASSEIRHGIRVQSRNEHLCGEIKDPKAGQICSVLVAGSELLSAPLHRD